MALTKDTAHALYTQIYAVAADREDGGGALPNTVTDPDQFAVCALARHDVVVKAAPVSINALASRMKSLGYSLA